MPINGKTADQMRKEFYEALDRERAAREARDAEHEAREAALAAREAAREAARAAEQAAWEKREAARAAEQAAWEKREAAREKRMAKLEAAREADRKEMKEWVAELREQNRKLNAIAGQWGNFTNVEGQIVESEGVAALLDLGEIGGMPIQEVKGAFKPAKKGREYDGVIHCPNARVLVECKRQLRPGDVEDFLSGQLRAFPRECAKMLDGHALYGAVVGALVEDGALALARENGLFVIRIPSNRRAEILENKASPRPRE